MMLHSTGIVGIAAVAVLSLAAFAEARQAPAAEVMPLGLRGVYFVENQGQWSDASVEYGFKSRGLDIAFRESSFTMHLSRERSERSEHSEPDCVSPTSATSVARFPNLSMLTPDLSHDLSSDRIRSGSLDAAEYEHLTLTITFPGSNPATPRGAQPQAAKFNYYIGDDETRWASNVPSFGAIVYENLYDGVDLHICGNDDGVLKYEFHVASGADWNQIRIAYGGIESLCIDDSGDLRIATTFGTLTDSAPLAWQEDAEVRSTGGTDMSSGTAVPAVQMSETSLAAGDGRDAGATSDTIPARFELVDATTYRFALDGPVDPSRTLIIDPDVEWMVYLGGSSHENALAIATDDSRSVLLAGHTRSTDFTGRMNSFYGGDRDAFVLKISPSGQLLWMTYLGGSNRDEASGIAADHSGSVLISGFTESSEFAGRNNSHRGGVDAFAVKVSALGDLEWMTYLGGSDDDSAYGIAIDGTDNLLVAGGTDSTDFTGRINESYGYGDAFVVKVSASGQTEWMTYLGGSDGEWAASIAIDSADNVLVTGSTESSNFVGRNNSAYGGRFDLDAFALKVDASGHLLWMTYLGGSDFDHGSSIAVDRIGAALVTGRTKSTDFAGRRNSLHGGYDVFAVKVSGEGQLLWMTYFGGTSYEFGYGIAVDPHGTAIITGDTFSTTFTGRINSYNGGLGDTFVLKASPAGDLQWMMYLGGTGEEDGRGVVVDSTGFALIAGWTDSTNFVGRVNSHYGMSDAYLLKLHLDPRLVVVATCPTGGPIQVEWSGATPGGRIALIFARDAGSFTIPPQLPCAGTQLGLGSSGIQLAFQGLSGPDGSRTLNASAGPGACGGYL